MIAVLLPDVILKYLSYDLGFLSTTSNLTWMHWQSLPNVDPLCERSHKTCERDRIQIGITSFWSSLGQSADVGKRSDWITSLGPGMWVAVYMGVASAGEIAQSLIDASLALHIGIDIVSNASPESFLYLPAVALPTADLALPALRSALSMTISMSGDYYSRADIHT